MKKIISSILLVGLLVGANAGGLQERYEENCKYFNIQPTKMTEAELKTLVPKMDTKRAEMEKSGKSPSRVTEKQKKLLVAHGMGDEFYLQKSKFIKYLNEKGEIFEKDEFGNRIPKKVSKIRELLEQNQSLENISIMAGEIIIQSVLENKFYNRDRTSNEGAPDGYVHNAVLGGAARGAVLGGRMPSTINIKTQDVSNKNGQTISAQYGVEDYLKKTDMYIDPLKSDLKTIRNRKQLLIAFLASKSIFNTNLTNDSSVDEAIVIYKLSANGDSQATMLIFKIMTEDIQSVSNYLISLPDTKKAFDIMNETINRLTFLEAKGL